MNGVSHQRRLSRAAQVLPQEAHFSEQCYVWILRLISRCAELGMLRNLLLYSSLLSPCSNQGSRAASRRSVRLHTPLPQRQLLWLR